MEFGHFFRVVGRRERVARLNGAWRDTVLTERRSRFRLDGGWGVDALLQTQTRAHKDLDIILPVADVPKPRELLAMTGFAVREGPDSFVLANGLGLEVDVHAVTAT